MHDLAAVEVESSDRTPPSELIETLADDLNTPEALSLLARLADGVDGVVPGVAIGDTVKRVERGLVAETIDREGLVAVQTPQVFVADRLRAAYSGALAGATDCASLVELAGGRVAVVAGDARLVKVTTADDLELVARLVEDAGS